MDNSPSPEQRPNLTPPAASPVAPLPSVAPLPPVEPTPGMPAAPTSDNSMGGLIPYKNSSALIAYYLGVFSVGCCAILGIPALFLGISGLKYYRAHPEAKGKVHAWIGIVLGGLSIVSTITIIIFTIFVSTQ